jgi:hypothetical protein
MVCGEGTVAKGTLQLLAVTFDATGKPGTPGGAAALQGPLLVAGSRHRLGVRSRFALGGWVAGCLPWGVAALCKPPGPRSPVRLQGIWTVRGVAGRGALILSLMACGTGAGRDEGPR